MAYTTIDNPELYFQSVLWTGNGSNPRTITFGGDENMQPDLLWYKCRSHAVPNILLDSVRGAGNDKELQPDDTTAEGGTSAETDGYISAFTSNGFTLAAGSSGGDHYTNEGSRTFVAWCWKAGTSFTNDASATSIGSIDSSGSVSSDAGFSILSYTGNGRDATIGHGLGVTPKMIIVKSRSFADHWCIYHEVIGNDKFLRLNSSDSAFNPGTNRWNDTSPTSTVFSVGNSSTTADPETNKSGETYIAYCFTDVPGYSKVGGIYTGNGNADGTFVYTGFRPAWIMFKESDGSSSGDNWFMFDNKRSTFNQTQKFLKANTSDAETDNSAGAIDILSNGWKLRTNDTSLNQNNNTYIYMAFAEAPFVNSKGVPCNAR